MRKITRNHVLSIFSLVLVTTLYPLPFFFEINIVPFIFPDHNDNFSLKSISADFVSTSGDFPIRIIGDANFLEVASRESWSGDGTVENPYLIRDLTLTDPSEQEILIEIIGTSVYFHID
ncbi:MAG: hypothetical protein ACW98F_14340, partial [Candidatus Hodarchaeales archaeon]